MMPSNSPRIVLAGSVNSSRKTLEKLLEHDVNVVGVLGLDPSVSENVSGFVNLGEISEAKNLSFRYFKNINSDEVTQYTKNCRPDFMFVVGLSQLLKKPLLNLPASGCIGFHPTKLPKGRGRAAVAWLILGKAPGAATFFFLREGMDDGPILAQKEFEVHERDYAQDVIDKIMDKIDDCLDQLLPQMKSGNIQAVEQDHSKATYLGKRNPEDGLINWEHSAAEIVRLIRAVSGPLPGAFSFINGQKVVIDKAVVEKAQNYIGVTGSILKKSNSKGLLVQSGNGLVWVHDFRGIPFEQVRRGQKFSSYSCSQFYLLNRKMEKLK